ncbi:MAG: ParA family protein [Mesorhizobium sp.]|uniref:ParA family protein n=1 Tax=Mesorhizobium sp. TaxID=1871066 RepID=UPI000FE7524B|nr:ParA family protein [Mesorhizobium sp.]RWM09731.1 MAG: ParA family protein [Mesorhizobium sp.]
MARRLSVVSSKGGAGKTTVAVLLAGEYALRGHSVLLIDSDNRQNLAEWWKLSADKNNVPANIELVTALTGRGIEQTLATANYDVIVMDTPGVDSVIANTIIANSDVVISPVQANQDEIRAVGQAAENTADIADQQGRTIPHGVVVTRIALTARSLEAYRFVRPFVAALRGAGYPSTLLQTELTERNCYREIRNGYGTLQMLDLTEPVKKARIEVAALFGEVETLIGAN